MPSRLHIRNLETVSAATAKDREFPSQNDRRGSTPPGIHHPALWADQLSLGYTAQEWAKKATARER
jgi:hypothetical protein